MDAFCDDDDGEDEDGEIGARCDLDPARPSAFHNSSSCASCRSNCSICLERDRVIGVRATAGVGNDDSAVELGADVAATTAAAVGVDVDDDTEDAAPSMCTLARTVSTSCAAACVCAGVGDGGDARLGARPCP